MDNFDKRKEKAMKTTGKLDFASNLMLAALLAAAAGCKTTNYETGNATAGVLKASAGKLETAKGRVDSTLAALNDLVNNPNNLPAQYAKYSDAVAGLQSSAKDVAAEITDMRSKSTAYFQAWDQQAALIKNADIKTHSLARKKEVLDRFTKVKLSYTQVSDSYHPFMSDLQDIQTALGTDLTADGIAAIKGAAQKANQDAIPLKRAGDDMSENLKDLGTAMYSAIPAPAATTATALK
jgi:chromosome segregation ATPase